MIQSRSPFERLCARISLSSLGRCLIMISISMRIQDCRERTLHSCRLFQTNESIGNDTEGVWHGGRDCIAGIKGGLPYSGVMRTPKRLQAQRRKTKEMSLLSLLSGKARSEFEASPTGSQNGPGNGQLGR
jgi:hypothetical protein